jgi:arylsulfatase A-like enzyme
MPDRGERQPNVIVVFTDQQRWDTLGVHGNPLDLTPNLDRMARYGTHAEFAFTPNPVCAPARAALQTGQYPTTTGVHRNGIPLSGDTDTLGQMFATAGYRCGYIGKWHLSEHEPVPAEDRRGYHHWLAANLLEFTSDAYRTIVFDDDGEPVELPGYRADGLTDAAIRFLADQASGPADEPFFLFLSFLEPHHQNHRDDYPAPEAYAERYAGRWLPPDLASLGGTAYRHIGGYCGQVKRLDECLGRLLDALRSLDLVDETIVAVTSDHGSHFRTRNAEYKRSCHDGSLRVPLVLRGPRFDSGGTIRDLVSTVDLVPTLLEACGIEVPEAMQGRSFLPLLRGERGSWPDHVFAQLSDSLVGRVLRTHRWKYAVTAPDADPVSDVYADRYTETELYDLEADPHELDNLVGDVRFRQVADELRETLLTRIAAIEGHRPAVDPAEPRVRNRLVDPLAAYPPVGRVRFGHQHRSEPA